MVSVAPSRRRLRVWPATWRESRGRPSSFWFRKNVEMTASPTVSIVIPNWNGAHHLRDCLGSLQELDYPKERFEVVVDNGSVDESRSLIESEYSWVRLIPLIRILVSRQPRTGARTTMSECVAFLNNDMRVEPGWLRALVASYEPADGYVCVAGTILDWEGTRIGFTRGWVNFLGHAGQIITWSPWKNV